MKSNLVLILLFLVQSNLLLNAATRSVTVFYGSTDKNANKIKVSQADDPGKVIYVSPVLPATITGVPSGKEVYFSVCFMDKSNKSCQPKKGFLLSMNSEKNDCYVVVTNDGRVSSII